MVDRNVRARNALRETIDNDYSHIEHLTLSALIALGPVALFAFILSFFPISPWAFTAIPLGLVLGNFIEYVVHRFPMHRPKMFLSKLLFRRHAGDHHRAFDISFMEITDPRDYALVMLPIKRAVTFMFLVFGLVGGLSIFTGPAFAMMLGMSLGVYFAIEEMLHLSFHFKSTWEGDKWWNKALRKLGRAHRLHHELKLMTRANFNIAFPIFDKLFGTLVNENDDIVLLKCGQISST